MIYAIRALPVAFVKRMLTEIIAINVNPMLIIWRRVMPGAVLNASVLVQLIGVLALI